MKYDEISSPVPWYMKCWSCWHNHRATSIQSNSRPRGKAPTTFIRQTKPLISVQFNPALHQTRAGSAQKVERDGNSMWPHLRKSFYKATCEWLERQKMVKRTKQRKAVWFHWSRANESSATITEIKMKQNRKLIVRGHKAQLSLLK